MKSLLKLGGASTRYKDILDFYYLINVGNINKEKLIKYFEIIIFNDLNIDENSMKDVYNTLNTILKKKRYLENFNTFKNNWLELPVTEIVDNILTFMKELELVAV